MRVSTISRLVVEGLQAVVTYWLVSFICDLDFKWSLRKMPHLHNLSVYVIIFFYVCWTYTFVQSSCLYGGSFSFRDHVI